jgi:hypothetical protein
VGVALAAYVALAISVTMCSAQRLRKKMQSILLKVIKYATGLDGPLAYRRDIMPSQGRSSLQLDELHMFEINQTKKRKRSSVTRWTHL